MYTFYNGLSLPLAQQQGGWSCQQEGKALATFGEIVAKIFHLF